MSGRGRFTYAHARPALTVDCVVVGFEERALSILLVRRGGAPFAGAWALPGGFVHVDETVEMAARRELEEETGLRIGYLEELGSFSALDRDPRERVISIAHVALLRGPLPEVHHGSDAAATAWHPCDALPELAFDHEAIVTLALERLRERVRTRPIGFELLPKKFPLRALQELYEAILGAPLDKRNFRKRVLELGILVDTGDVEQGVAHRAAALYRFDERRYRALEKTGLGFAI